VVLWLKSVGLVQRSVPPGAMLYLSREPSELSQWLCHDGSTIHIVIDIIDKQSITIEINGMTQCTSDEDFMCLVGYEKF